MSPWARHLIIPIHIMVATIPFLFCLLQSDALTEKHTLEHARTLPSTANPVVRPQPSTSCFRSATHICRCTQGPSGHLLKYVLDKLLPVFLLFYSGFLSFFFFFTSLVE